MSANEEDDTRRFCSPEQLGALHNLRKELCYWSNRTSPTETAEEDEVLESVERGAPVHTAVVAGERAYGGNPPRLPPHLNDRWARFYHAVKAALLYAAKFPGINTCEAYPPELYALRSAAWHAKDDFQRAVEDEIRLVEAAGAATKDQDGGVRWQAVAESLERLRTNGERFTSQPDYAKRLGCSPATVNKAIERTPTLQEWAKRPVSSTQWATSLDGAVLDNTPQGREADPADVVEPSDVDAALAYLVDNATPEERARIHAMSPAEQRQLAELAYRDPDREDRILGRED